MHIDAIVGQPFITARLKSLCRQPYESSWLAEGPPGCGKTSSALAVAADLGCDDAMSGLHFIPACKLGFEHAKELFEYTLRHRPLMGYGWKVVVLDELERLPSKAVADYLKTAIDEYSLPVKTIVFATSNDTAKMEPALMQRFEFLAYSNGPTFQAACLEEIERLWKLESADDMPPAWRFWGSTADGFSMRIACRNLKRALKERELVAA